MTNQPDTIPSEFRFNDGDTLIAYTCRFLEKVDVDKARIAISPAIGKAPWGPYTEVLIAARWLGEALWPRPTSWPLVVNVLMPFPSDPTRFSLLARGQIE